jgi:hypothetical protein
MRPVEYYLYFSSLRNIFLERAYTDHFQTFQPIGRRHAIRIERNGMQMTLTKRTKILVLLLASIYFFAGIVPEMHFHNDGDDNRSCPICDYYQNYQSQDLPVLPVSVELILIQPFSASAPVPGHPIIVTRNDLIRAPPD